MPPGNLPDGQPDAGGVPTGRNIAAAKVRAAGGLAAFRL
ncbi:hypothetical protein J2S64_002312 [Paeniglutamicibacter sulfureus]|uniref:Uncharacterized protein n=1 Tax=Paeniglutamicibacter sulfureus TaxID=43666 RepID=A0ABU2BIZ5_9MICC|nr:hypothetical protein [Paeniglutamicibacter sulfureus]